MPYDEVMGKFKRGELKSGSKGGPPVKNKKQAVAIMMSEKREAGKGKTEYQAHNKGGKVKPSESEAFKQNLVETAANPTSRGSALRKGGRVK